MLKLYHTPQSTCSQRVRMALTEKGIEWEERLIDWIGAEHLADWYLKLNPNGVVPTLVHNGEPIRDSSVICEYLDDVFPDHPLRPADPLALARMREWRQYIDEVPTAAIRAPSFNRSLASLWQDMSEEEFEAFADKHPLRADFYRKMGQTGFDEAEIAMSIRRLSETLQRMENGLSDGRPWLNGEDFSLADISVMPTIVRMEDLGHAEMWSQLRAVTDWYERLQARPAFAVVYSGDARAMS